MTDSPFSYRERRAWAEFRQETQKEFRHKYWRVRKGILDIAPDHEEFEKYHQKLFNIVENWALDVSVEAEKEAEERPDIHALWHEVDFGDFEGLGELAEPGSYEIENPPPADDLLRAGMALNNLFIIWVDFHHIPPVVEDPWSPDEYYSDTDVEQLAEEWDVDVEDIAGSNYE